MTTRQRIRFNLRMWIRAGLPRIRLHILGQLYLLLDR